MIDAPLPTVDVVITTYRRPIAILKRAVDSAVDQTYPNITVAIVNDDPENTELAQQIRQLAQSYDKHAVQYVSYEKNRGANYARNFGAASLSGAFLAFLDDDDEWLPDKLALQLKGFASEEIGFVYSPFYSYGMKQDGQVIVRGTAEGDITAQLLGNNTVGGCSMVTIRRIVFEQVGGFDEAFLSLQDYDLWMRLAMHSAAACVNAPLTKRYMGKDSVSVNFGKRKQGWDRFIAKYEALYAGRPKCFNRFLNRIAVQCMGFGQPASALAYWKRAVKACPLSFGNLSAPVLGLAKLALHRARQP